jgi:hypothetical protein
MYKRLLSALVFNIFGFTASFSQTFIAPNYALKSHETLEINKIEINQDKTVVFLSVENQRVGGRFCADRNIYIIYPDGLRVKLDSSSGIPVCPDTYKFKTIGEKLDFTLTFPALAPGTGWIDIVEDCNENCFTFYGVTLDNDLNKKVEEAYLLSEKGELILAISGYKNILTMLDGKNHGLEGAIYSDIITLLLKSGDKAEAKEWYGKMISSKAPGLDRYIRNLNSRGIKF